MATELFSLWGMQTGWRSQHSGGYQVIAELDGVSIWRWAETAQEVEHDFTRACRRTVLRRYFKWLAPPPAELFRGNGPIDRSEEARRRAELRETAEAFSAHGVMADVDLARLHELTKPYDKDES